MVAQELVEQLGAAASFLAQLDKGSQAYKDVLDAQSTMAMSVMASWTFISAEDSASLVLQISQVPFGKKQMATLLGRVTGLATASAHMLAANAAAGQQLMTPSRTPQQDFTSITEYLTAQEWDVILHESNDFLGRVGVVLQACKALGWRTIHEPTVQVACCIALHVQGVDWTLRQCPMALWGYYKRAKTCAKKLLPWKVCKDLAASEPSFVQSLPPDPKDMEKRHPEVYSRVFGGGAAHVACPLDATKFMVVRDGVPMRESKGCYFIPPAWGTPS